MPNFKETPEVEFDGDGFAVHRECGGRIHEWHVAQRIKEYHLNRDGTTTLSYEGCDDTENKGTYCEGCEERVTMETEV